MEPNINYMPPTFNKRGILATSPTDVDSYVFKVSKGALTFDQAQNNFKLARNSNMLYQPIVDCKTKKVFASAILMPAERNNGKSVLSFERKLENNVLRCEFDRIRQTFNASKEHRLKTGNSARLFIPITAYQIQEHYILNYAETLCFELSLPPSCFIFEILECDAIIDVSRMRKTLRKLRNKGFSFALNNYIENNHKSTYCLKHFGFDYIKIKHDLIKKILNPQTNDASLHHLNRLCMEFGILTVAESVESEDALDVLQKGGIDYAQVTQNFSDL